MQADNSEVIAREYGGPSPELLDYVRRVKAVADSPG